MFDKGLFEVWPNENGGYDICSTFILNTGEVFKGKIVETVSCFATAITRAAIWNRQDGDSNGR